VGLWRFYECRGVGSRLSSSCRRSSARQQRRRRTVGWCCCWILFRWRRRWTFVVVNVVVWISFWRRSLEGEKCQRQVRVRVRCYLCSRRRRRLWLRVVVALRQRQQAQAAKECLHSGSPRIFDSRGDGCFGNRQTTNRGEDDHCRRNNKGRRLSSP